MRDARRYHVTLGCRRTTVSLDNILSNMLALTLDQEPETAPAHRAVRAWLQHHLDSHNDPGRCLTSQWLKAEVVCTLVNKPLAEAYSRWCLRDDG